MAKESYIERLQRERQDLVDYARAVRDWTEAIVVLKNTSRKGSALKEVERLEKIEREKYKTIEPYLAE